MPPGVKLGAAHKWEEDEGMGNSLGYNRVEGPLDYKSANELVHLLVDTVSKGGNLLLDIGPTADGRIPVIMQERLLQIGAWLKVNGEAIYGTHPWRVISEGECGNMCNRTRDYGVAAKMLCDGLLVSATRHPHADGITM